MENQSIAKLVEEVETELSIYNRMIGGCHGGIKFKKTNHWGRGGKCRLVAVGYRNRRGSFVFVGEHPDRGGTWA